MGVSSTTVCMFFLYTCWNLTIPMLLFIVGCWLLIVVALLLMLYDNDRCCMVKIDVVLLLTLSVARVVHAVVAVVVQVSCSCFKIFRYLFSRKIRYFSCVIISAGSIPSIWNTSRTPCDRNFNTHPKTVGPRFFGRKHMFRRSLRIPHFVLFLMLRPPSICHFLILPMSVNNWYLKSAA